MLAGLSPLELGRLRMSVGYGTHKRGRPLSPVEVGSLLRKALDEGVSLGDCADAIQLEGTGHIGRFLRILELPDDLQHLIDWGSGKDFIGFTAAVELARADKADQHVVADAILSDGLNSKEVRDVIQLLTRSGNPVARCVKDVLGMRQRIEKRYVFLGSVGDEMQAALGGLSQVARDDILEGAMASLGLRGAKGRLGAMFFTLVGDEAFRASMSKVGRENIESSIRGYVSEVVEK